MILKHVSRTALGAVLVFGSGYVAMAGEETAKAANGASAVPADQIHVVTAASNTSGAVIGGTVLPYKMVKLLAQMPGEVESIAGREGDEFKKGTKLVSLDTDSLLAKRRAAEAGLNSARAGYGNAIVQYNREVHSPNSQANSMLGGAPSMFSMFSDPIRAFSGQGSPGYERHSSLYGQGVQIQTSRDQIAQAEAGIQELDEALENASSEAPFDGVVTQKMVEVGDIVQPGMPLAVFADISVLDIQAEIPSRLIGAIKEGATIKARIDRSQSSIDATVSRIFPMANMGGHTTTVKFRLPTGSGARAGMYAEVIIPDPSSRSRPRPSIPESSVVWRGSLPAVFKVSDDKTRLEMTTLRLGSTSDGRVSVISGLQEGDTILKSPPPSTRSGPYKAPTAN